MKSHEGMFRELVENSEDIIIVTDPEFRIRYSSSSVTRVFGHTPVSLLGRSISEFISRDKVEDWREGLKDQPGQLAEELALNVKGNKTYFDAEVSVLLENLRVQGLVLKLHDITDKKEKEQDLIRSNQQLDQVIYKTTHDLKAPLMSAIGLINLAEQASVGEKDQYIGMIKKSLLKLDAFIEEMNNFFRNEKLALQREKIDLKQLLLDETMDLRNLYHGNEIDVRIEIDEQKELFSDRMRIKTVLTNILSNAIKYRDLQKPNPFINIAARVADDFCDICFEDNGIGIAPEYQGKIFDLFFRATDQSQGSGLGLFIVKDTVEKLKGSIEVYSKVGEGTQFRIRIPNQLHQPVEVE
jgi:hypothetical protein